MYVSGKRQVEEMELDCPAQSSKKKFLPKFKPIITESISVRELNLLLSLFNN